MIILRQKEYMASPVGKLVRKVLVKKGMSPREAARLATKVDIPNKVKVLGKNIVNNPKRIKGKVISGVSNLHDKTQLAAGEFLMNSGKSVSKGVETALENPLTVASLPTPVPTTLVHLVEKGVKKIPVVGKVPGELAKVYKNSPAPAVVEAGVNTARNFFIGH